MPLFNDIYLMVVSGCLYVVQGVQAFHACVGRYKYYLAHCLLFNQLARLAIATELSRDVRYNLHEE